SRPCSARPARPRFRRSRTSATGTGLSQARKIPWKAEPESLLRNRLHPIRRLPVEASREGRTPVPTGRDGSQGLSLDQLPGGRRGTLKRLQNRNRARRPPPNQKWPAEG